MLVNAIDGYLNIFLYQVRSSDVSWSDTRRTLRKDHRWESGSLLEREEKEKLFNEHIEALTKKKKEHFRQLLDETSSVREMCPCLLPFDFILCLIPYLFLDLHS